MTKAQLIKEISKREGKKAQVSIGNIREIVSILEQMIAEDLFNRGMPVGQFVMRDPEDDLTLNAMYLSIKSKLAKLYKENKKRK